VIDPATNLVPGTTYSVSYPAGLIKDASGNSAPALAATALLGFTTAGALDTAAPTLVSTSPLNNASGVTSSRVVLTFNEPVMAGVGSITISNGADTRTINVTDITQVTFSGNTANINPSADFLKGSTYNVQLPSGVIKDASGNPFAGIANATTLSFNTAAPAVVVVGAPKLLITEVNSNAVGGDFFELYNYGTVTVDLAGWKWDDDSASFSDAGNAAFGSVSIAPGQRLVVINATTTSAFITAWNIPNTVTVVATGGPGLGGGDAVVIFDAAGKVVTSFNFKGGTVTMVASDGSVIPDAKASAGVTAVFPNHAGLAFGGTAITSAVWDGVSTSAPTYKAAAAGVLNGYAQPAAPTAIGSPGQ
jgi:Bacterial Ig-like domain/Lamin Tail Domain